MANGVKTSVYLRRETAAKLAQANEGQTGGRRLSISTVTDQAAGLYLDVIQALKAHPACRVRYTPDGFVVEADSAPDMTRLS